MNRTSRTEEPYEGDGLNQSPNPLSSDLTTNQDFIGVVNSREQKNAHRAMSQCDPPPDDSATAERSNLEPRRAKQGTARPPTNACGTSSGIGQPVVGEEQQPDESSGLPLPSRSQSHGSSAGRDCTTFQRVKNAIIKFGSFVGPGFMIAVAYIDPGNYATDVAAGATYRFRLLFVVLLANLFAIFLQTLCIKLGTVTGLNLAESCRAYLPRWLNLALYLFAEVAIIATDIAEVIGFAIGLNLLAPAVPLVAGCAISILDVMVILFFYRPHGTIQGLRAFEIFILVLVLGVVVCFCIQLSMIQDTPVGDVFKGYLPSKALVEQKGLYQACGILGATVMPHSLYLGSGIVQPRLRDYDEKHGLVAPNSFVDDGVKKSAYVPSLRAIRHSLKASTWELGIALFTFALFVNSAILIVAGVSLYDNKDAPDADIFSIHDLLSKSISPAAGTIFALALLLSGITAGVVCTISGQMVSEGALDWRMRPWLRRLMTRSISITPSIIIAGAVGRSGLSDALNASQVVLSVVLPFVTAPLIYFTCRNKFMTVQSAETRLQDSLAGHDVRPTTAPRNGNGSVKMANSWYTTVVAVIIWVIIAAMNIANLALLGKGE